MPVYDYALMTEPLTARPARRRSAGPAGPGSATWPTSSTTTGSPPTTGSSGAATTRSTTTAAGSSRASTSAPETFDRLAGHFFETFPQLEGLRFSHQWGGAIDTCTRFCAFYGTAHRGRVAYAVGYTGLGVGATRFGAQVVLDLLDGRDTERTRLQMVRQKPLPFPPEPLAYAGIQLTRWSLARADRDAGRRNLWLRTLDRAGLGLRLLGRVAVRRRPDDVGGARGEVRPGARAGRHDDLVGRPGRSGRRARPGQPRGLPATRRPGLPALAGAIGAGPNFIRADPTTVPSTSRIATTPDGPEKPSGLRARSPRMRRAGHAPPGPAARASVPSSRRRTSRGGPLAEHQQEAGLGEGGARPLRRRRP